MDVRDVLAAARRQWWVVLQAMVLIGAVSLWFDSQKVPTYQASSRLLVSSPDIQTFGGSAAYAQVQAIVIRSEPVAQQASKLIDGRPDPLSLLARVSVTSSGVPEVLQVIATTDDPSSAVAIANGFTLGYLEYERATATSGRQQQVEALQGRLADLQTRIAGLNGQLRSAPTGTGDPALEAERAALLSQYGVVFSSLQVLQFDQSATTPASTVLSLARGSAPIGGSIPVRAGVLGIGMGLLLGAALAVIREYFDDRLRTRGDLERLGLVVLGELPEDRASSKTPSHTAVIDKPQGTLAERIRSLRSTIDLLGIDDGIRRILVTSPNAEDGKSLVSVNLAAAYAQAGFKTVLVGADLRRARTVMLELPSDAPGLGDLLSASQLSAERDGSSTRHVVDLLLATRQPGLSVLPPGKSASNPAALLASRLADEVLDELTLVFDIVIIDTAPTLVADAASLATFADGVVLIARAGRSRARDIERALAALEGPSVRVIGAVLNRIRRSGNAADGLYYVVDDPRTARRARRRREDARR